MEKVDQLDKKFRMSFTTDMGSGCIILILFSRSQNAWVGFFAGDHKNVIAGNRIYL